MVRLLIQVLLVQLLFRSWDVCWVVFWRYCYRHRIFILVTIEQVLLMRFDLLMRWYEREMVILNNNSMLQFQDGIFLFVQL